MLRYYNNYSKLEKYCVYLSLTRSTSRCLFQFFNTRRSEYQLLFVLTLDIPIPSPQQLSVKILISVSMNAIF